MDKNLKVLASEYMLADENEEHKVYQIMNAKQMEIFNNHDDASFFCFNCFKKKHRDAVKF